MLLEKSNVSMESKPGLFFTFRGDKQILPLLTLKLEMTIIVQKPFVACIPITPLFLQVDPKPSEALLDPLIGIQVFGQPHVQYILRNRALLKQNILYIYFPSNIYVDEKVNKIYQNSYENLSREVPKHLRNNIAKLILFQTGNGDNSVDQQRSRCSDALSYLFKLSLEKRVEQCISEINSISITELKSANLSSIFKNKSKLAYIYRKIGLDEKAEQILSLLWQDMLYNQRCFTREAQSKVTYLPPFVQHSYSQIVRQFSTGNSYLRICCFSFFKIFQLQVELMNYCDSMKKLKHFIQFGLNNIFTVIKVKGEIVKHLWIVSIIDEAYEIVNRLGRAYPTFLNPQKEEEYQGYTVSLARVYRTSLEILGTLFYNFDSLALFPRTIEAEVDYCLNQLSQSSRKVTSQPINDVSIIGGRLEQNLLLLLGGVQSFKWLYLKSLINQHDYLNRASKYKRMARSVKLNMLKTYLSVVQPQNLKFPVNYTQQYGMKGHDLYGYIQKIMKKAEKISNYDQEDAYINDALFKRSLKYEPEKDNFINRNREDEVLWPLLKFIEDYYYFILLLITHRNKGKDDRPHDQSMLSLSFSRISHKYAVKTDNVIHLMLNEELMKLKNQWSVTVSLVREIFLRERGQQGKIEEHSCVTVRMGILLDAGFNHDSSESTLVIKVNNQQLLNLIFLSENDLISLQLSILDVNKRGKLIKMRLIAIKMLEQNYLQLQVQILTQQCLIFIIRQLQVKIGLMVCYYVNKDVQLQQFADMQEQGRIKKKKNRKYSSFEQKLREQQFTHMINKSEHLTLNHIHYHTLKLECDYQSCEMKVKENRPRNTSSIVNRERNTSSIVNRERNSSSHSTIIGLLKDKHVSVSLFLDLWTPVVFRIKPIFSHQTYKIAVPLHRILPMAGEMQQVSDWLRINKTWVNKSNSGSFSLQIGSEGIELVLMVRCKGGKQMIKSAIRPRKGSNAMSHSGFSSNASWQRGESLRLQLQIQQDEYTYLIETSLSYTRNKPIEVKYIYCQELEEYTIVNLSNHLMKVFPSVQGQCIRLKQSEEMKLELEHISLEIDTDVQRLSDEAIGLQQIPTFISTINLKQYVKKELLKPYKLQTIDLVIDRQLNSGIPLFKKLQLVKIKSKEGGLLSIIDCGRGFELVGRVQGEVSVFADGNLDLYLLPVLTGKLILPSLLIGGKKGVWKQSIFINVVD